MLFVKLNNPPMGTETSLVTGRVVEDGVMVKLNNPPMGTETGICLISEALFTFLRLN